LLSLLAPQGQTLTTLGDLVQTGLLFACYAATLPNQTGNRGRVAAFWLLLAAGFGLWLVAQGLWTSFEVVLRKDVPDPFIGDVILFMHIIPMLSALWLQPHKGSERSPGVGIANSALAFVWSLTMYVYYVIPWQYVHFNRFTYDQAFDRMYVTANLAFVVSAGILWLQARGKWKTIYAHLFFAGALYAVASYLASYAINLNRYYTGSLYDVPLVAAMLWFAGIGLLAREKQRASSEAGVSSKALQVDWETVASVAAMLSVALLGTWEAMRSDVPAGVRDFRFVVTEISTVLLGVLVLWKQRCLRKARPHAAAFASAAGAAR
jgi:hypothetical protein